MWSLKVPGQFQKICKVQKLKGLEPGPEPTPPDVENIDEKPSEGSVENITYPSLKSDFRTE